MMTDREIEKIILVGISGVTCGGKTTTTQKLRNFLSNCEIITQDDYFLDNDDPRHTWIPELNHVNYDILTSLDMDKMYKDVLNIFNNKKLQSINHNSKKNNDEFYNIQTVCNRVEPDNFKVVIVEGFSIFNYEPMVPLFDLKYYFTLPKDECYKRRALRVYEPPDVPGYFEICAWPEHISQLKEVRTKVENVHYFSGTDDPDNVTRKILEDIYVVHKNK